MAQGNGVAAEMIEQSYERLAEGKASEADRTIIVMSYLVENQRKFAEAMRPKPFKLFGREWSPTELAFLIGGLVVIDTAAVAGLTHLVGG